MKALKEQAYELFFRNLETTAVKNAAFGRLNLVNLDAAVVYVAH